MRQQENLHRIRSCKEYFDHSDLPLDSFNLPVFHLYPHIDRKIDLFVYLIVCPSSSLIKCFLRIYPDALS